jgi:hypothetical protein
VQYEKQDEYHAPIEVISRLRIERETHVFVAVGWKQHFQRSKRVHAIVCRENILTLWSGCADETRRLAIPAGTIRFIRATYPFRLGVRAQIHPPTLRAIRVAIRHVLEGRIRDDDVEGLIGKWQWRGWIDDDRLVNIRIGQHNRIDVCADDAPSFASQV